MASPHQFRQRHSVEFAKPVSAFFYQGDWKILCQVIISLYERKNILVNIQEDSKLFWLSNHYFFNNIDDTFSFWQHPSPFLIYQKTCMFRWRESHLATGILLDLFINNAGEGFVLTIEIYMYGFFSRTVSTSFETLMSRWHFEILRNKHGVFFADYSYFKVPMK